MSEIDVLWVGPKTEILSEEEDAFQSRPVLLLHSFFVPFHYLSISVVELARSL